MCAEGGGFLITTPNGRPLVVYFSVKQNSPPRCLGFLDTEEAQFPRLRLVPATWERGSRAVPGMGQVRAVQGLETWRALLLLQPVI